MRGNAGRGRLGLLARRLPDRRRPRRRGGLRRPARPGLGARHPAGQRHGAQPHGHRLALGHRASRVVPVARRAALPGLHLQRAGPVGRPAGRRSSSRTTTGTTATRRSCSSASTAATGDDALRLPRQRRHELPVERHGAARLPRRRRSASRSSRRSSTSPGASRSSASTPRWSSPRSTSSGCGGPSPGPAAGSRRAPSTRSRRREFDARMPVEFWREVVDRVAAEVPGTLLLAEAFWLLEGYFVRTLGHAPRLQQRVHAHAPRRGQRRLPQGHQGDHRVRPGDPQALRQLHEQPRREDRRRAVRQGRQVLRRRDGAGDAARAADARPRPGRGLRREVRHGVPPGDARRAAGPVAGRPPRARDLPAAPPAGLVRRGGRLPAVRLRDRRRQRRRGRSSPIRTARAASGRWSSTTTGSRRRADGSAIRRRTRARRRAARSGWSAGRSPRAWACRTIRRRSSSSATRGPGWSTCARVARSGSAASTSRSTPTGPRLLGVPRGVATASPGSGRGSRGRLAGAGVPSLDEALRELQLEPVHAPLRAVFADGLVGAVIDGDGDRGAARRAGAAVRRVPRGGRRRRPASTATRAPIAAEVRARAERVSRDRADCRPARRADEH